MPSPQLLAALELMARQDGTAHVSQLLALGVTRAQIASRLGSGSWREVHPGVVAAAGGVASAYAELRAAYLALRHPRRGAGTRSVAVSGSSAGRLYGWPLPPGFAAPPVLAVPDSRTRLPVPARRVRRWEDRQLATVAGFVTMAPADAVIDLAAELSRDELFAVVQEVTYRRPEAADRMRALCHHGVAGSACILSVLGALDVGIDSVLHEHGHGHLGRAGLPPPECGVTLFPGFGSCDCVLRRPGARRPPWGLIVGWDGELHRLRRRKYRHDQLRDRAARAGGWLYNHYGWADHVEPADMHADLQRTWQRILNGEW